MRPELEKEEIVEPLPARQRMSPFKRGIAIVLAGTFLASVVVNVARPQGALTLVQIIVGGAPVSVSNPLPVNCTSSC